MPRTKPDEFILSQMTETERLTLLVLEKRREEARADLKRYRDRVRRRIKARTEAKEETNATSKSSNA